MKNFNRISLILIITFQTACTTIPDRFNTKDVIVDSCGYVVESENSSGFVLEVVLKEYKFFPSADPVIVAARECFTKVASELARRKGKSIAPLTAADMGTTTNRNTVDGNYLVNVAGKVSYAVRPQ